MSTMTQNTRSSTRWAVSADGTRIAYDVTGTGPALVIVEGAMCQRTMGTAQVLRDSLSADYSVVGYDRRGRGESGPGERAYAVQREVEDLVAVIEAVGNEVFVLGTSSGAALALEAARQGVPMKALAAYEAPFIVDGMHAPNDLDLGARTQTLVEAGKRGEAIKLFMKVVGAPAPMVAVMPVFPVWKKLKAVAHTLPHDYAIVLPFEQGEPLPAGYYAGVQVPAIVIAGGKSPEYMRNSQAAIVEQLPNGRLVTLKGQTHMVKAKATTPVLRAFFR